MTVTTAAPVPGISAAEQRCLEQGAREFFQAQGMDVLAEFVRREGAGAITGDFRALTAPAACREPAQRERERYDRRDSMHWMYIVVGHAG